ncbi:MAG: putative inorganic pyrophosphatase [Candidatus Saccharibacteria bacterium]|nr:putative inorganic pyrophosphatase [Candidatus Saccharibacteria bacterium]
MKVITSGLTFLDIDAYAGCVAYAELLNLQGIEAIAFSSANINESVTKTIRSWEAPLVTNYEPSSFDTFTLIDVSEPDFLEKTVDINRVEEVIDHHVGYEKFWEEKIGSKANLEFIGAACTQVYESWARAGRFNEMSETSAKLLLSGILDNTLNFKAGVTTNRDHEAYEKLSKIANLPADWPALYFEECEASILSDLEHALINDTKVMSFKNLDVEKIAFGQMVIWNGKRVIDEYRDTLAEIMNTQAADWFVNVVSISDGQSFLIASGDDVERWAAKVLGISFENGLAHANRLWLRKEIVKQDSLTQA